MSSIFLSEANSATAEELKNQGKVSAAIRTAGAHELVISKMYETTGDNWSSKTVEFANSIGETIKYQGFFGVPKSTSEEDVQKAEAQTKRTLADVARIIKAAGVPDIKAASGGAVTETDDKGRTLTVFPKVANKKLIGVTYTLLDGQKKDGNIIPDKVYVKQELDTFKFLDKSGKDQMGRDRKADFDAEAKTRIEIGYSYKDNPKHIAKLAELQHKLTNSISAYLAQVQEPLAGMPTTPAVMPASDDI